MFDQDDYDAGVDLNPTRNHRAAAIPVGAGALFIGVVLVIATIMFAAVFGSSSSGSAPFASTPIDLNAAVRAIADAQGVAPGSAAWCDGGAWPYGGTTGGHPYYGWRRMKWLAASEANRRAAIANIAHRAQFYWGENVWFRSDYEGAGRPKGWVSDGPPNLAFGPVRYLVPASKLGTVAGLYPDAAPGIKSVDIYGIEAMHWWPETLIDIARFGDARGWMVPVSTGNTASAAEVARSILTVQITSVVGALNGSYESTHFGNERAAARILEGVLGAAEVGALLDSNAATVANWLDKGAFPDLAHAPGCTLFDGNRPSAVPPVPAGRRVALVWQWAWCGAAFARLARDYPAWAPRAIPVAKRYLRWTIEAAKAFNGKIPTLASFDPVDLGPDSAPALTSIAALFASGRAGVHDEYDFSAWCYRPMRFAASLGLEGAAELAAKIEAVTPHSDANAPWMVDDFGRYVWPELAQFNDPFSTSSSR